MTIECLYAVCALRTSIDLTENANDIRNYVRNYIKPVSGKEIRWLTLHLCEIRDNTAGL